MMRARRHRLWSWSDYRYPLAFFGGISATFLLLCALIGVMGLYRSDGASRQQVVSLNTDSQCRSGIATKVDVALLDAFDFILAAPARGTPEEAAHRTQLLHDIEEARAERASTNETCNATGTTTTSAPPSPAAGTPEKASTP